MISYILVININWYGGIITDNWMYDCVFMCMCVELHSIYSYVVKLRSLMCLAISYLLAN